LLRLVENFSIYSELELKNTISTNSIVSHPEMIIEKICQNLRVEYKRAGDINWTCRREALAIPEDHFKKIVYELVDNAFKFSGAGSLIGGVPT
jgi:signal transduction histidine kinase